MPVFIGIDTTSKQTQLALVYVDNNKDAIVVSNESSYQAESIISLLDELLSNARADLKDISGFGVASGPGSFTGIRNGIATLKAIDFACNKERFDLEVESDSLTLMAAPTLFVPTLLAYIHHYCENVGVFMPVLKANDSEVFCAIYGVIDFDSVSTFDKNLNGFSDISFSNRCECGNDAINIMPISKTHALITLLETCVLLDTVQSLNECLDSVLSKVSPSLLSILCAREDNKKIIRVENDLEDQSLAKNVAELTRALVDVDKNMCAWSSVNKEFDVSVCGMYSYKSRPIYAKGVNALTLVERGITQG